VCKYRVGKYNIISVDRYSVDFKIGLLLLKWFVSLNIKDGKEGVFMIQTRRWHVNMNHINEDNQAIEAATNLLIAGSTVAFPTETVYGLGADATNKAAVANIFQAKGRPADNPLIAHVATKEQLELLVSDLPAYAEQLIDRFTPGPITFILPSNGICAENVTAGLSTIAVRIPDHPIAQQLLINCDIPIAAPSANTSGKPSPTTGDHVWEDLSGKIAGLLDGGATGVGMESTIIDCTGEIPMILRPGGITKEQLEYIVGTVLIADSLQEETDKPKAPGMKYKHYSPEVPLILVNGTAAMMQTMIDREQAKGNRVGVLASSSMITKISADQLIPLGEQLPEIAAHLYDALRLCKQTAIDIILCETFPETDIGDAIMNRLRKAASTEIHPQDLR